jgi:hypothetical protein
MGEAKRRGTFEQRKKEAIDNSKVGYMVKKIRPFTGRKAALVSSILFTMGAYFLSG